MRYLQMFTPLMQIGLLTAILMAYPNVAKSQIQLTVDGITYICFDNSELLTPFNKNKYLRAHYREQKKR